MYTVWHQRILVRSHPILHVFYFSVKATCILKHIATQSMLFKHTLFQTNCNVLLFPSSLPELLKQMIDHYH